MIASGISVSICLADVNSNEKPQQDLGSWIWTSFRRICKEPGTILYRDIVPDDNENRSKQFRLQSSLQKVIWYTPKDGTPRLICCIRQTINGSCRLSSFYWWQHIDKVLSQAHSQDIEKMTFPEYSSMRQMSCREWCLWLTFHSYFLRSVVLQLEAHKFGPPFDENDSLANGVSNSCFGSCWRWKWDIVVYIVREFTDDKWGSLPWDGIFDFSPGMAYLTYTSVVSIWE